MSTYKRKLIEVALPWKQSIVNLQEKKPSLMDIQQLYINGGHGALYLLAEPFSLLS